MQHAMHMDSFAATIKVFGFGESVGSTKGRFTTSMVPIGTRNRSFGIQELMASSGGGGGGGGSTGDEFSICITTHLPAPATQVWHRGDPTIVPAGSGDCDTNGFHGKGVPGTRRDF